MMSIPGLTVKDMVEKTRPIYNNITEPENKCHICNEEYKSDDICRKIEIVDIIIIVIVLIIGL